MKSMELEREIGIKLSINNIDRIPMLRISPCNRLCVSCRPYVQACGGGSGSSRLCGCTRVTRKWVSLLSRGMMKMTRLPWTQDEECCVFFVYFTGVEETKPDVLEQWIYAHFSIAVSLPFNITSTPCSRSMPHNSPPTHTSSSSGVKDTSTAHVSAGGRHDATRCGDGDRAWCRQKLAGCYSAIRLYLSRSYSSFT
ncbi:hypothetical protein BGW80DRAFT_588701 [Lactifluus volemus]|nr:hypothetical protein BGW80DRAFT_588701 [Lactifluus volemus]